MKQAKALELFEQYADHIYRFALSYTGSKADAEDILQDVFLKLLDRHITILPGKEKSYLLKMTANMSKNFLRKPARERDVSIDSIQDIEAACGFTQEDSELFDALMGLPDSYREVIHLYYYEGYSYKEIARTLKISMSAVSMRMNRARNALKKMLEG